jgi:hypothetical protein
MKKDDELPEFYLKERSDDYETMIEIYQRIIYKDKPACRFVTEFDGFDEELANKTLAALNKKD